MAAGLESDALFNRNGQESLGGGRDEHRQFPFAAGLAEPLGVVESFPFDRFQLSAVRRFVDAAATEAGVDGARRGDVVLAASELAANSIVHGGGTGEARVWPEPGAFLCEVVDRGVIVDPMVGRRRPSPEQLNGRGLWIVAQIADALDVHSDEDGSTVRFRIDLS
jgi:anti-sigma regulatory factor (Ser/Thr protein kinase)